MGVCVIGRHRSELMDDLSQALELLVNLKYKVLETHCPIVQTPTTLAI